MMKANLHIDTGFVRNALVDFLKNEFKKSGFKKTVLGLSGGVDSALVCHLAAEALGAENVHALCMPYKSSNPDSEADARQVAQQTGVNFKLIPVTPMVDAYFAQFPDADNMRRGNKMARERMSILFDHSSLLGALVLGTSNKTELLLGYSTIYGDLASALNPIGDLYKSQVWQLSEAMGVCPQVIKKQPSADLWAGQTDEADLGFTYHEVDQLFYLMIEKQVGYVELLAAGFSAELINKVQQRMRSSQFKRRLPLIAKLTGQTVGQGFTEI